MIKRSGLPRGCTYEAELLIEWPNWAESITHLCPYSSPAQRKPDWERWVGSRPGGLSQADQLGGWQLPAADSTDRRNALVEAFGGCFEVEGFPRSLVQPPGDGIECVLMDDREVHPLGEVLP